mmetsp:Transcript_13809/g.21042  ORF Transcript_13809/g.21042 Transcript_13809/m.21042 type:complete len:229 (-) Transcript_13809:60-746(-)
MIRQIFAIVLFSVIALQHATYVSAQGHDNHGMDSETMGHNGSMMGDTMGDEMISVYCAKPCSSPDESPCGEGNGQTASCISISHDDMSAVTSRDHSGSSFLGCSHAVCKSSCATADMDKKSDVTDDGTICFPNNMEMSDEMFMDKETAELAAIARGCEGTHLMSNNMHMVGSSHMACNGKYSYGGGDGANSMEAMTGMNNMSSSPTATLTIFSMTFLTSTIVAYLGFD